MWSVLVERIFMLIKLLTPKDEPREWGPNITIGVDQSSSLSWQASWGSYFNQPSTWDRLVELDDIHGITPTMVCDIVSKEWWDPLVSTISCKGLLEQEASVLIKNEDEKEEYIV